MGQRKSYGATSEQQAGWGRISMFSCVRYSCTSLELWTDALPWSCPSVETVRFSKHRVSVVIGVDGLFCLTWFLQNYSLSSERLYRIFFWEWQLHVIWERTLWHPNIILGLSIGLITIYPCVIACDFFIQASGVTVFIPFQKSLDKRHPIPCVFRCQNMWGQMQAPLLVSKCFG